MTATQCPWCRTPVWRAPNGLTAVICRCWTRTQRARTLARITRAGRHSHRWSPGPYTHLERLRQAAYGDHICRPFTVVLDAAGRHRTEGGV